jgi:hypothetical protein
MEPEAPLPAELRELGERVDRARVRRAGRGRDEQRRPSGSQVRVHRGGEAGGLEAERGVGRQHAYLVGAKAEDARGPGDRRVRLIGDVRDEAVAHRAG